MFGHSGHEGNDSLFQNSDIKFIKTTMLEKTKQKSVLQELSHIEDSNASFWLD